METNGLSTVNHLAFETTYNDKPWGGTQDGKNRILALGNQGAYQRNDFSESRLLHLPIQRKTLNSLT